MKKTIVYLLLAAICLGLLTGCGDIVIDSPKPERTAAPAASASGGAKGAEIKLNGKSASFTGGGVSVNGSTVTISSPGEYSVSGTLESGSIVVNTGEVKGDVTLTLRGAQITNPNGAAIHVQQVKNFVLVLEQGTQNRLVSGEEGAAVPGVKLDGAALFAEDDVDILGEGSLEVIGYLNNGITCKDDLDILGGEITVSAVNNGVRGSESVEISGGTLAITAGNDGIKSTSALKEGKGFVTISGGTIMVTAGGDGISAETELTVTGGEISVTTTGAVAGVSCKGIKAKMLLSVSGGTILVDSEDHALHSSQNMLLTDGSFTLSSRAGKGISANGAMEIHGGSYDVRSADDGIDAESALTVAGGEIRLLAGADGLKAGNKTTGTGTIEIRGGTINVSAYADPIDAKSGAVISGGTFAGVGTSKTPKGFAAESSQRSLLFSLRGSEGSSAQVIAEANGAVVGTVEARCGYTFALFSTPELTPGGYRLVLGSLSASANA